jgi:hypothetical protein
MYFSITNNLLALNIKATNLGYPHEQQRQQLGIVLKTLKMGPLVWNILRNAHIPSQKAHSKTNGE